MGSVCCVARNAATSEGANGEISRRTIQHSPSWGVRWDNRGRVAGEETPVSAIVESVRRNNRLESKSELFVEPLPEVSISEGNCESNSQSLLIKEDAGKLSKTQIAESPGARKITLEVDETMDMPAALDRTLPTTEPNIPSASYLSTFPLPPKSQLAPACSTPSNWSPHIPRSQLLRQGSGTRLCEPKSPCNLSASEGRLSPLLPVSSIESTRGSHGRSSDSWSVQSFPERATSTHNETRSFDELFGSPSHKLPQSHSRKSDSDSHSNELKTCVVCAKYLLEKSSFSSQKIVPNNELSVVAILVCGHVYHADCLEHLTPEISKYDPPCPVCMYGEEPAMNMFKKLLKEEMEKKPKKHRSRIVNSDIIPLTRGSSPSLESSPSLRSSFTRPFLKRHFSFGSK